MNSQQLAVLIAGIALGVSLMTFVWRIVYDIYFDAPRLKVELRAMVIAGYGSDPEEMYVVTATNKGRRATRLTSLWLCFGRPRRWWWRWARLLLSKKRREELFKTALMMPDMAGHGYSTKMPCSLGPAEQAQTFYARDAVHKNATEYAERFIYGSAGSTLGGGSSKALRISVTADDDASAT